MPPEKQNASDTSADEIEMDSKSEELEVDNAESTEDTEASSSAAEDSKSSDDEERKNLLDVVKDAVVDEDEGNDQPDQDEGDEYDDEEAEASESKEDVSSTSKGSKETDTDASEEFTEEEIKQLKPSTQKRIRALNSKLEEAYAQAEEYKPDAESYRKVDDFMQKYGITPEESAEAFTIMALVKTDPNQALQRMQKHIDTISGHVGETLPADLLQKVEEGSLSEQDAKELSKARAQANIERQKREAAEQRYQKQQQEAQSQAQVREIGLALDNWQTKMRTADPDYDKKNGLVKTQLKALISELGQPKNPEEANRYADIAYGMVNQSLGSFMKETQQAPQKREKRSIKSRSSSGPAPERQITAESPLIDVARKAVGK